MYFVSYGIEITGASSLGQIIFDDGDENAHLAIDNVILSHLHIHGPDVSGFSDASNLNDYARGIGLTKGKVTNLTVDLCYIHDHATVHVYMIKGTHYAFPSPIKQVRTYSLHGELIMEFHQPNNLGQWKIDVIPPGVHIVQIVTANTVQQFKILVTGN